MSKSGPTVWGTFSLFNIKLLLFFINPRKNEGKKKN